MIPLIVDRLAAGRVGPEKVALSGREPFGVGLTSDLDVWGIWAKEESRCVWGIESKSIPVGGGNNAKWNG